MKSYSVCNASQIDNLSDEYYLKPEEENQMSFLSYSGPPHRQP